MQLIGASGPPAGGVALLLGLFLGIPAILWVIALVHRSRNPSAGKGRKRLLDSDDWIDLGTSPVLASWRGKIGPQWGLLEAQIRLLRTERGALILEVPGSGLRFPYLFTLPFTEDYIPATPQCAVNWMCATGGKRRAKKLFPDLQPEPLIPNTDGRSRVAAGAVIAMDLAAGVGTA